MANKQGGVWQSVTGAAGAMATAVASSAEWSWEVMKSKIYGTVPGWEFGAEEAGVGAGVGCAPLIIAIVAAILFVVAVIALISVLTSSPSPNSLKQSDATGTTQQPDIGNPSMSSSVGASQSGDLSGGAANLSAKSGSGTLEFEARLQRERLNAIANGTSPVAYQQLLAAQRQEYADRGLDPCASNFFPAEACAGANGNEKSQANPPPVPPVSTPANPPPPDFGSPGGIKISQAAYQHVIDGHTVGGAESQGNSIFNQGENIVDLIRQAEGIEPTKQSFGSNFERIVDAGRPIGIDRVTGQPTSVYTVITDSQGNLVTAFPGTP